MRFCVPSEAQLPLGLFFSSMALRRLPAIGVQGLDQRPYLDLCVSSDPSGADGSGFV
jgi:hypothetical protein